MSAKTWQLIVSGLLAFTRILHMDPKEANTLCHDAIAATKNKSIHSYVPQYAAPPPFPPVLLGAWTDTSSFIAIGRKPEADA
jgi:hypothetical protein